MVLRAEVTRASKIWLWIFSTCFTQITDSKIDHPIGFDWFFFFSVGSISFDCRAQSNSIHELSSIEFDWNLVRLGSIYYAGRHQMLFTTCSGGSLAPAKFFFFYFRKSVLFIKCRILNIGNKAFKTPKSEPENLSLEVGWPEGSYMFVQDVICR